MSKEHGRNQRRTMVADKVTQIRMLKRLLIVPMTGFAVMGLLVIISIVCLLMEVQSDEVSLTTLPLVIWSVALFIGGSAGFLFMSAFRFSYRVAGPTYRMLKSLEEFQDNGGEFRIRLRDGDELQDLAAKLNEVMNDIQAEPYGTPVAEKTSSEVELSTATD